MKTYFFALLSIFLLGSTACSTDTNILPKNNEDDSSLDPTPELYFPPLGSLDWETTSTTDLKWNTEAEQPLKDLLEEHNTKAFIILKDGKIAMENYFGSFSKDSIWYWASAGKTLTAFSVGIAQEKKLLSLDDKTSFYLGEGWTSAPLEKENLITIRHQLSMTSGLKDTSFDCTTSECLEYEADAGTLWAYHNGPYTLLQDVIREAVNVEFTAFFNTHLRNKIGMNGFWLSTNGSNNVFFSTARSMARFGLLNLNSGIWDGETILGDTSYVRSMINTSQDLNKAYGYLWWLNGKESYKAPALQTTFQGELIENAPPDTFSGLGKNDQKLYVVPSRGLVIVRLGEDSGEGLLGPSSFDNLLWEKISELIN